ncbi:MAG: hypothetical protein ACFFBD_08390, partial [Candidatus Hodarchaeota archaeon]
KLSDLFQSPASELPSELIERYINESNTPVEDLLQEYNISETTFYRKLPPNIRRLSKTPDSPELRRQIIIAYIQEHSVMQVSKQLHLQNDRVRQILREAGFNTQRSNRHVSTLKLN